MSLPDTFSLLILGSGSTGCAVASWALAHPERVRAITVYGGAKAEPSDRTAALEIHEAEVVLGTEQIAGHYDVCVASPGISEFSEFFAAGRAAADQIMGEPEFAWRLSPERWCAVTGTNGKTTTTTLIDHLLRASDIESVAVGNIGEPTICEIDRRHEGSWMVAELSSFQLATTSELHPRVGVLLNITDDHLAWHRTHENYALAKIKLFQNMQGADDLAIIDVEDPGIREHEALIRVPGRRVLDLALADTGARDAAFVRDGVLTVRLDGEETALVAVSDLKIAGHHNQINALAAAAAALFCGASATAVRTGLVAFHPLEHRVEPCGTVDGVRYYNDSKATNTDAVEKALTAFPHDRVILLVGGHDKGTPLEAFADVVCAHVVAVVCFGAARARFHAALAAAKGADAVQLADADDLFSAVDVARGLAQAGDVILLSPACSSFDQFHGFEERGRKFKEYVDGLRHPGAAAV